MKSWRTLLVILVLGPFIAVEVWLFLIPNKYDAKNARYLGWRYGLPTLSTEDALLTMAVDSHHDDLVIGKSRDELEKRFGFVTTLAETDDYNRACYREYHKGDQVLFLRKSRWMIVMQDNRAKEMIYVKGC